MNEELEKMEKQSAVERDRTELPEKEVQYPKSVCRTYLPRMEIDSATDMPLD